MKFLYPAPPKTPGDYYTQNLGSTQYSDKVSKISSFGGETLASGIRIQADHHLRQTITQRMQRKLILKNKIMEPLDSKYLKNKNLKNDLNYT